MKRSCPICEKLCQVEFVDYEVTTVMKGKKICYVAKSYKCDECNEFFDTIESLNDNLEIARKVFKCMLN